MLEKSPELKLGLNPKKKIQCMNPVSEPKMQGQKNEVRRVDGQAGK